MLVSSAAFGGQLARNDFPAFAQAPAGKPNILSTMGRHHAAEHRRYFEGFAASRSSERMRAADLLGVLTSERATRKGGPLQTVQ